MLKIKVAIIMYYTHKLFTVHIFGYRMKLDNNEKEFIKQMANMVKDADLASELTRIRFEFGVRDRVTIDQVRKARYSMGIEKVRGRGRCHIKRKNSNE